MKSEKYQSKIVLFTINSYFLKELANIIVGYVDTKVVFYILDVIELGRYSKATKAIQDSRKLKTRGLNAKCDIRSGPRRIIDILKKVNI